MPTYSLVNYKMLAIALAKEEIFAKRGSMICYTGKINFTRSYLAGGGVQNLAMREVTNEELIVMRARGTGKICYGYDGKYVTIIPLRGEMLYIETDSVLAYDSRLQTGTIFQGNQGGVQGIIKGVASGQGLFTTTFSGSGEVAIISQGDAIALEVTQKEPIFVDPNAYLGHKGMLTTQFVTDVNWKTLIGQTSGESYQFKFTGQGTVYIQAYEREKKP
ncbi:MULTISPECIES: AIM24 family protein [Spirulina sp. CCY15215]|uniref:AIM24 family protein n=1 Tax=Spirulina sp. CCY15215 TaxID=2767591 RepID=UPI001950CAAE|nr:AIM24 family protein [Spirulina major]